MTAPSVLKTIAESVSKRLEERRSLRSERELDRSLASTREPRPLLERFTASGANVIAEVKLASPSQGEFACARSLSPVGAAGQYLASGARALSVLTEQDHFNGSLEYLSAIRKAFPDARLLLKDFVIDRYQLLEARHAGADAALLIVSLLGEARTRELLAECDRLGLTALVEVHDEEELGIAARIGSRLIGVNNRDLKTLEIDLATSFRLAALAPRDTALISESGIGRGSEMRDLARAGFSGFLIGTSLMRTGEPGRALARLLAEAE